MAASGKSKKLALPQDRFGTYFIDGCRVYDIYASKYGTVTELAMGHFGIEIRVQYDGEKDSKPIRGIGLEILSGGIKHPVQQTGARRA